MAKLEARHYEYLKNAEFLREYLENLNSRLIYSSNQIEDDNVPIEELYDKDHVLVLRDNFKAFRMLFDELNFENDRLLTEDLLKKVCNTINKHSDYISNDYRTLDNGVKFEGKYPIAKVCDIKKDMEKLLYNYYNTWKDLDIFEREARFNIEFLRIHPFDDGNGRTSRLILNYNLLNQGHAPAIIPKEIRKEYFSARNREDVKWIKELFEKESKKELEAIDKLIIDDEKEKGMML